MAASGIDRLRFNTCGDLLDAGAVMVDETGRTTISGVRMLLAVQATRATHTFESIVALCRIGRGAQAAMLNRSLLEDALDVSWTSENPDSAPAQADEHERLIGLGERALLARFGREAALSDAESAELKVLLKRYDNFRASWTLAGQVDRLAAMKRAWPAEASSYLDQTYEVIQRQNNTLLHGGPTSLAVAMMPGRRGFNRVGPDAWWPSALAHGVLGYYLICRVVAREFDFAIDDAMDAYFLASCFTKQLGSDVMDPVVDDDPCPCGSRRTIANCHRS